VPNLVFSILGRNIAVGADKSQALIFTATHNAGFYQLFSLHHVSAVIVIHQQTFYKL
jgi:hypothetical protein